MTEQILMAYDNWFHKYFGKDPLRYSCGSHYADIQAAFEAGFKLGTFLQTGKSEAKQTR